MRIINYYFWVVAIVNLIIDMATKRAIVNYLQIERTSLPIIPNVFHFTYIRNYGAAFSMLEGQPWLGWLSLIVSAILVAIGIFRNFNSIWEQVGLGAILAGAAGNGIDRLFFGGSVVDFIDLRIINFAIFNWADISINVGVVCLLIHTFIDRPHRSNSR